MTNYEADGPAQTTDEAPARLNANAEEFPSYLEEITQFTDEELIPAEAEMVRTGEVPPRIVGRMASLGLFGMSIPRQFGGLGWSMEEQVRLTMEFTRASCVYRSRFSTTVGLASQIILDFGTKEQRARYLPRMARGECVGAFALTEPQAGSDASALQTVAEKTATGWSIKGRKRFITNAAWADLLLVAAKCTSGYGIFLVDGRAPGVTSTAASRMNGHEAGPVAEVFLDDVAVSSDAIVGGTASSNLRMALRGLNHARLHVAGTAVGQSTRLLEEAARHVAGRSMFGQKMSEMAVIQARLGRCYAEALAVRALALECARAFDAGTVSPVALSAAKLTATETAFKVADTVLQMLGGEGIVGDSPVPRMWRDIRALRIYEGASEIHERNIGRHVVRSIAHNSGRLNPDVGSA